MSGGGCRVLVFGRYPAPGRVKTRLASSIGADAACAFYSACLAHTLTQASEWLGSEHDARSSVALCYSEAGDGGALERWSAGHKLKCVELVAQVQNTQDLGCRLRAALADGLARPGVSRAIVLASDAPDLSAAVVRDAAHALVDNDVVFGPSVDGGYYLVGCRGSSCLETLFSGIPWSTPTVLEVSLALARKAGLQVAPRDTLPTLLDIDRAEDLHAWSCCNTHTLLGAARAALEAGRG